MITLLFDTSTERGYVAYFRENEKIWEEQFPRGLLHSRHLMLAIEKGSKELSLSPQDISALAIGLGPGSYTGLRITTSVAMGISFAKKIPVYAVSSLWGFIKKDVFTKGAALFDAKMGGVYAMGVCPERQILLGPALFSIEEAVDALGSYSQIFSPQAESLKKRLPESIGQKLVELIPDPLSLLEAALQVPPLYGTLEPLYLRRWTSGQAPCEYPSNAI